MEKVPPSEKLSKEIGQLYSGVVQGRTKGNLPEELIEKSVRMVMQKILEREVSH